MCHFSAQFGALGEDGSGRLRVAGGGMWSGAARVHRPAHASGRGASIAVLECAVVPIRAPGGWDAGAEARQAAGETELGRVRAARRF